MIEEYRERRQPEGKGGQHGAVMNRRDRSDRQQEKADFSRDKRRKGDAA